MKSHKPRSPGRKGRFCWHKQTGPHGVTYRLFRRLDTTSQVKVEAHDFEHHHPRDAIAYQLRRMRRELRDLADRIDLKNLGVEA